MKRLYIVLVVATLCACSGKPQTLTVTDSSKVTKGSIDVHVVHFSKDNGDFDPNTNVTYPDEHYGLAVRPSADDTTKPISDIDFGNISAVGVHSNDAPAILTNDTYLCSNSTDFQGWFGCRLPLDANKSTKLFLTFLMKNGSLWTSDPFDMKADESGDNISSGFISLTATGNAKDFTLQLCPTDPYGKQAEVPVSQSCPSEIITPTASTDCPKPGYFDEVTKTCVGAQTQEEKQKQQLCGSGNFYLLGGGGACGSECGEKKVVKMGKCVCINGYMQDPNTKTNCIVDPSFNANLPVSPTTGGGSCSLIR